MDNIPVFHEFEVEGEKLMEVEIQVEGEEIEVETSGNTYAQLENVYSGCANYVVHPVERRAETLGFMNVPSASEQDIEGEQFPFQSQQFAEEFEESVQIDPSNATDGSHDSFIHSDVIMENEADQQVQEDDLSPEEKEKKEILEKTREMVIDFFVHHFWEKIPLSTFQHKVEKYTGKLLPLSELGVDMVGFLKLLPEVEQFQDEEEIPRTFNRTLVRLNLELRRRTAAYMLYEAIIHSVVNLDYLEIILQGNPEIRRPKVDFDVRNLLDKATSTYEIMTDPLTKEQKTRLEYLFYEEWEHDFPLDDLQFQTMQEFVQYFPLLFREEQYSFEYKRIDVDKSNKKKTVKKEVTETINQTVVLVHPLQKEFKQRGIDIFYHHGQVVFDIDLQEFNPNDEDVYEEDDDDDEDQEEDELRAGETEEDFMEKRPFGSNIRDSCFRDPEILKQERKSPSNKPLKRARKKATLTFAKKKPDLKNYTKIYVTPSVYYSQISTVINAALVTTDAKNVARTSMRICKSYRIMIKLLLAMVFARLSRCICIVNGTTLYGRNRVRKLSRLLSKSLFRAINVGVGKIRESIEVRLYMAYLLFEAIHDFCSYKAVIEELQKTASLTEYPLLDVGKRGDGGTCPKCDKYFDHKKDLDAHALKHSVTPTTSSAVVSTSKKPVSNEPKSKRSKPKPKSNRFKCNLCPAVYSRLGSLLEHKRFHHRPDPISCPYEGCGKKFVNHRVYFFHHSRVHVERNHICDICSAKFKRKVHLDRHLLVHSDDLPYPCTKCSRKFKDKSRLLVHFNRAHPALLPYACSVCSGKFDSETKLKKHKRIHDVKFPFSCDKCGASFPTKKDLHEHLRVHSDKRPFVCPICSKSFRTSYKLSRHQIVHSNDRPHVCHECEKSFKNKASLTKHLKVHSKDGLFPCPICNKQFASTDTLQYHLSTHRNKNETGQSKEEDEAEMPIDPLDNHLCPCPKCKKIFASEEILKDHMMFHSKDFSCSVCSKKYKTKGRLELHQKICGKETPNTDGGGPSSTADPVQVPAQPQDQVPAQPQDQVPAQPQDQVPAQPQEQAPVQPEGDPSFPCITCDKLCKSAASLIRHMVVHDKNHHKFSCSYCSKTFSVKKLWKSHEIKCTKKTTTSDGAGPSSSVKTPPIPTKPKEKVKCSKCGKSFSKGYISRHKKECKGELELNKDDPLV